MDLLDNLVRAEPLRAEKLIERDDQEPQQRQQIQQPALRGAQLRHALHADVERRPDRAAKRARHHGDAEPFAHRAQVYAPNGENVFDPVLHIRAPSVPLFYTDFLFCPATIQSASSVMGETLFHIGAIGTFWRDLTVQKEKSAI